MPQTRPTFFVPLTDTRYRQLLEFMHQNRFNDVTLIVGLA